MIIILVGFLILGIIIWIPYLLSSKIYNNLEQKGNKNANLIAKMVFLVGAGLLGYLAFVIIESNLYFGR